MDHSETVQVVMVGPLFERFKDWLDREVDAVVFKIPGMPEDELPTYGVSPRSLGSKA